MSKSDPQTTPPVSSEADDGTIEISPEAAADLARILAEDPKAEEAFREMFANMRQAMQSVKDGRYADFNDALQAITGRRPQRVEEIDE